MSELVFSTTTTIGSYRLLEKDLRDFFEFVEPADDNLQVFSHRAFALLLRACTEFENICKVGASHHEVKLGKNANIKDYAKLESHSGGSFGKVVLNQWAGRALSLDPLLGWGSDPHGLTWYREFNLVKHSREQEFAKANLSNVLNAISACLLLLVGLRFVPLVLENHTHPDDTNVDFEVRDSIFAIRLHSSQVDQFSSWRGK